VKWLSKEAMKVIISEKKNHYLSTNAEELKLLLILSLGSGLYILSD